MDSETNVIVSHLNMKYFILDKNVSGKIVEDIGSPLRIFTEAEDEKNGVITSAKGLCN